MRIIIATLLLTGLAAGTSAFTAGISNRLMNKAAGLPDERPRMPEWMPPAQQKVLDDFNDPNNQFEPLKEEGNKLVPVDPERRAAAEWAEICRTVSQTTYIAVWLIPAMGIIALCRKPKLALVRKRERVGHAPEGTEQNGVPDEDDETADTATIDRMAAEIEEYLAIPPNGEESFRDKEERRSVHELLEQLKENKA